MFAPIGKLVAAYALLFALPVVHSMGDAGMIMFGPVGRDILGAGTVIFAVCATGGQLLAGQIALQVLSDSKLCLMLYTGIFAIPTALFSLPRTLDRLSWLSVPSVISIIVAGLVAMIGAEHESGGGPAGRHCAQQRFHDCLRLHHQPGLRLRRALHVLHPDLGDEGPSGRHEGRVHAAGLRDGLLPPLRHRHVLLHRLRRRIPLVQLAAAGLAKAAYGLALPNFLIAGSLYAHTAAKLIFVRLVPQPKESQVGASPSRAHRGGMVDLGRPDPADERSRPSSSAVGVPIFNYLIGIAASLFATLVHVRHRGLLLAV